MEHQKVLYGWLNGAMRRRIRWLIALDVVHQWFCDIVEITSQRAAHILGSTICTALTWRRHGPFRIALHGLLVIGWPCIWRLPTLDHDAYEYSSLSNYEDDCMSSLSQDPLYKLLYSPRAARPHPKFVSRAKGRSYYQTALLSRFGATTPADPHRFLLDLM